MSTVESMFNFKSKGKPGEKSVMVITSEKNERPRDPERISSFEYHRWISVSTVNRRLATLADCMVELQHRNHSLEATKQKKEEKKNGKKRERKRKEKTAEWAKEAWELDFRNAKEWLLQSDESKFQLPGT